jgi:hypothetical protein
MRRNIVQSPRPPFPRFRKTPHVHERSRSQGKRIHRQLPVSDAAIFAATRANRTTGFRRLGFESIWSDRSQSVNPLFEASKTGSWCRAKRRLVEGVETW